MNDYPTVECPNCHREQTDMDGFGFIACLPLPGGCGYCTHPSATMIAEGVWLCGICSTVLPDRAAESETICP